MSQCDNFFCNVIDINGETIAIISDLSKNRTLFIIEDIPNLANIEFEYLKNLDKFSFLFTTRDTKFRTNEISHRVYQHGIEKFTKILYNEKDDKFFVDIGKTKNGKFHYITINSKDTTEVYLLIPNLENNLQNNLQDSFNLFCLQKRKIGQQFFFEFHEETNTFFIVTNKEADGELELFTMKIENLSQLLSQKIVDNICDNIYFYNTPLSTLYPLQKIYTPQKNQSIFEIDLFSNYLILSIIDQSLPKLIKINLHTLQNSLQNDLSNDLQNIDNTLQIFENLEIFKDLHFIENKFNVDYNCKYFHIKGYSLLYKDSLQFIYNLETNEYFTIFGNLKNLETNLECEIVNVDNEIPIKIVKSKHYNQPVDNVTKNCDKNCNENDTYCFLIGYGAYNTHLLEDLENYHNNNLFFYYRDYFLQQSLQQQHSSLQKSHKFIFVYCHVHGGKENGQHWYQNGKLKNKKNSMIDLLKIVNYLNLNYKIKFGNFIGRGISAGGLLMMSTSLLTYFNNYNFLQNNLSYQNLLQQTLQNSLQKNTQKSQHNLHNLQYNLQKNNIFHCLILKVPFLDILTCMLDENLPLTQHEFDEYGNPLQNSIIANEMINYSPYHLLLNYLQSLQNNLQFKNLENNLENLNLQNNLQNNLQFKNLNSILPNIYITASVDDFKSPLWNIMKIMTLFRKERELLQNYNLQNTNMENKIQIVNIHELGHVDETSYSHLYHLVAQEILFIEKTIENKELLNNNLEEEQQEQKEQQ